MVVRQIRTKKHCARPTPAFTCQTNTIYIIKLSTILPQTLRTIASRLAGRAHRIPPKSGSNSSSSGSSGHGSNSRCNATLQRCAHTSACPNSRALPARRKMATAVAAAAAPAAAATAAELAAMGPVMGYFAQLAAIPRPSRLEAQVQDFVRAFADARGLKHRTDAAGNVVVYKPGQGGGEGAPPVILQGHVDMVTEKNADTQHDWARDPITLVVGGDGWLRARGTTLGADNGVGVAAMLAALDLPAPVPHPPLEALFTVEEEIGLLGASALDASLLSGRVLVNLDSEDWGVVYIGSAGAGESNVELDVALEPLPADAGLVNHTLSLTGLQGGHSGLQIDAGLGNAVQLLAGAVAAVLAAVPAARVAALSGGDKRNAIPREARAALWLPAGGTELAAARAAVEAQAEGLRRVYGGVEPGARLTLEEGDKQQEQEQGAAPTVLARAGADALLSLLLALPHGPVRMSPSLAGLVETSNNVASVRRVDEAGAGGASAAGSTARYLAVVSTRSSIPAALATERARIAAVARLAGARVEQPPDYAGWAPNPESGVLQLAKAAIAGARGGREPRVTAIHAGLECGVLGAALGGGVDMVSYGPTILGAHSPDERLELATVRPFWGATLALLAALAARRA